MTGAVTGHREKELSRRNHEAGQRGAAEVEILAMLRVAWASRRLVIACGVIGALLGIALAVLSTRVVSQGLLMTPGLTLSQFKQYEAALASPVNMAQFTASLNGNNEVTRELMRIVKVPGEFNRAVSPAFSLTGREAKLYDVAVNDKSSVVGLRLSMRHIASSELPSASYLADYVRHTLLQVDLVKRFARSCTKLDGDLLQAKNFQIEADWELDRIGARIQQMEALLPTATETPSAIVPQIVPADQAGFRFLPLSTQLVAARIEVSDVRQQKANKLREETALTLQRDFYCRAKTLVDSGDSASNVLIALAKLRQDVFATQDMAMPVVQQTANKLAVLERGWLSKYLEEPRLMIDSDPEGRTVRAIGRAAAGIAGLAFGLGLGLLLALGRHWLARASANA